MANEPNQIDEDLYDGLQQARKKKPRNFVLFAKGVEVVGLIVQKKAINDGVVQKAKTECKGNLVIRGVCFGEGVELKFEVVGEEPSITPKKVRDFIEEKTDLTLKPYWAVVKELTAVEEEETAPSKSAAASASAPRATDKATPERDAASDDAARLFNERLKVLLPKVKAAAGTPPGEEAKSKVKEAGTFAGGDYVKANALLDRAEEVLKGFATSAAGGPADDPATLFNERLRVLLPKVKAAAGTPPGEEAKSKVKAAGTVAGGDYVQANALLDQAEEALQSSPTSADEPATKLRSALRAAILRTPVSEDDDELQETLAALGPAFLAVAIGAPETSSAPLAPGAQIPEQDRMADIAGQLDSVGRKIDQWNAALDEAEAAKSSLTSSEPGAAADAATQVSYAENRAKGQALMVEIEGLLGTIREQCRTLENASGGTSA